MIETNLPILYLREVVLLPFNEIRLEFTEDKEKLCPKMLEGMITLVLWELFEKEKNNGFR